MNSIKQSLREIFDLIIDEHADVLSFVEPAGYGEHEMQYMLDRPIRYCYDSANKIRTFGIFEDHMVKNASDFMMRQPIRYEFVDTDSGSDQRIMRVYMKKKED